MIPRSSLSLPAALTALVLGSLFGPIPGSSAASDSASAIRFFGTGSGQTDRVTIPIDDNAGGADASTPADIGATSFTIEICVRGTLADNTAAAQTSGTYADNRWRNGNIILDRDIWSDGTGNVNDHNRDYGVSFANGRVMFGTGFNGADSVPDGENTVVGSANVLDGSWHHIACVRDIFDGSKTIYVDGALDVSVGGVSNDDISYPDDGVAINPSSTGANHALVIGAEKHDAGPAFPSFNGYFDELRLWKAALPLECVARFDNRVLVNPTPGRGPVDGFKDLVGYYRFEEGAGAIASDSSGLTTNNNGTVVNGTAGFAEWVNSANDPGNTCAVYNGTDFGGPLVLDEIVGGLVLPLYVTSPPGDNDRLFIIEQRTAPGNTGRIRIFKKSTQTLLATSFLEIPGVNTGNEEGLLGLAFHPNYAVNGYFYIYYSSIDLVVNPNPTNRVSVIERYTASDKVPGGVDDPDIADPASAFLVLTYPEPQPNHNGGWMGFRPGDPNSNLYVSVGDGGGSGDNDAGHPELTGPTSGNAQNKTTFLGKILRLDVDGADAFPGDATRNYAIPASPPFTGPGELGEIWNYGVRNPWRCSFDRLTSDFWIGDVGQNAREEVNFQPASSAGGENYGWRLREGLIPTPDNAGDPSVIGGARPADNVDPILDYPRTEASGFPVLGGKAFGQSVSGGYVYRGSKMPALQGTYFHSDYEFDQVFSLRYCGNTVTEYTNRSVELNTTQAPNANTITSFGEDNEGNLYLCRRGTGATDGQVLEFTQNSYFLWRNQVFTVSELSDPAISGIDADIDGDSMNTIMEFVAGKNPKVADGPAPLTFATATDGGVDEFLTLTLMRDAAGSAINVFGESGADLADFDEANTVPISTGDPLIFKVRDSVPVGSADARFLRLQLQLPSN